MPTPFCLGTQMSRRHEQCYQQRPKQWSRCWWRLRWPGPHLDDHGKYGRSCLVSCPKHSPYHQHSQWPSTWRFPPKSHTSHLPVIKKKREDALLVISFQPLVYILSHKRKLQEWGGLYRVVADEPGSWMLQIPDDKLLVHPTSCSHRDGCWAWWKLHTFHWLCMRSQRAHHLLVWLCTSQTSFTH